MLIAEYGGAPSEAAGTEFVTSDALGSQRLITAADGTVRRRYDYLPFGQEIGQGSGTGRTDAAYSTGSYARMTPPGGMLFTGKERDAETGLDYFGLRYMSAAQGRFTSPDPNNAGASLYDPQSWNAYSYTLNNPLKYVDPDGDVPIPAITGAVGAGGGAILGGAFEAWKQYSQHGEVRSWGKVGTAAMGGFVSGGLAGLTLGIGAAAGAAATTAEVVVVNASSSVIGGYTQRRTDEALGYDAPADNATELANIAVDAGTGAVFGYVGGRLGDNLFPIPNVRREIALARFAHRRSQRPTLKQGAQRNAERQALLNSGAAGAAGGIPTEITKWIWEWFTTQASQRQSDRKKEVVTSRICYEDGSCAP